MAHINARKKGWKWERKTRKLHFPRVESILSPPSSSNSSLWGGEEERGEGPPSLTSLSLPTSEIQKPTRFLIIFPLFPLPSSGGERSPFCSSNSRDWRRKKKRAKQLDEKAFRKKDEEGGGGKALLTSLLFPRKKRKEFDDVLIQEKNFFLREIYGSEKRGLLWLWASHLPPHPNPYLLPPHTQDPPSTP